MYPSLSRKLALGLAAAALFVSAPGARAENYILRKITLKCAKLTNLTGTAYFQWRAGATVMSNQMVYCTGGNSMSLLSYQPASADNWALSVSIDSPTQNMAQCPAEVFFPAGSGQTTTETCAAGSAKTTFSLGRASGR
jgi:hypothetical protein